MLIEVFKEAWIALGRNRVRSLLTMTGISWGIVAVTLLLSYGSGFRSVLLYTFEVFGKGAVICWPGTTSEQAGGERAGKPVRFEQEDAEWVKAARECRAQIQQGLGLLRSAVINAQAKAGLKKVSRHGQAHASQADKADCFFHRSTLLK